MERAQINPDLRVGHATHAGMTGKHNEDFFGVFAWKVDEKRRFDLGVVADGVGGQTAGEVASHVAVEEVQKYFDQQSHVNAGSVSSHLERAILAANQAVLQASKENPAYQGMSTTMAVAAMLDGRLYTAHVGDSRIYLLRDGRLQQISVDHTWAQEAIEAGLITPEQAKTHPNRNVIRRHLGGSTRVEVDHRLVLQPGQPANQAEANQGMTLQASDTVLICSDGLTDMISDSSVYATLREHFSDLPVASQDLVNKANQAGGKDNITVVLMQVSSNGAAVILPPPAAAAATSAAAATNAAPATTATAVGGTAAKAGLGRATWLIIGGAVLLLLVMLAVGTLIVVGSTLRERTTPESTVEPVLNSDSDATFPAGAPATAAILATALGNSGEQDGSGPLETPGLIPTLRSTVTATPRRGAAPVPTATFTVKATAAPTSASSSSSSSNRGSKTNTPPPPTDPPPPPTDPPPPPTDQPPPPTDPPPPPTDPPPPPTDPPPPPTDPPPPPTDPPPPPPPPPTDPPDPPPDPPDN